MSRDCLQARHHEGRGCCWPAGVAHSFSWSLHSPLQMYFHLSLFYSLGLLWFPLQLNSAFHHTVSHVLCLSSVLFFFSLPFPPSVPPFYLTVTHTHTDKDSTIPIVPPISSRSPKAPEGIKGFWGGGEVSGGQRKWDSEPPAQLSSDLLHFLSFHTRCYLTNNLLPRGEVFRLLAEFMTDLEVPILLR